MNRKKSNGKWECLAKLKPKPKSKNDCVFSSFNDLYHVMDDRNAAHNPFNTLLRLIHLFDSTEYLCCCSFRYLLRFLHIIFFVHVALFIWCVCVFLLGTSPTIFVVVISLVVSFITFIYVHLLVVQSRFVLVTITIICRCRRRWRKNYFYFTFCTMLCFAFDSLVRGSIRWIDTLIIST